MQTYVTVCPYCGRKQRTSSKTRVKCMFCGKTFDPTKHLSDGRLKDYERSEPEFKKGTEV